MTTINAQRAVNQRNRIFLPLEVQTERYLGVCVLLFSWSINQNSTISRSLCELAFTMMELCLDFLLLFYLNSKKLREQFPEKYYREKRTDNEEWWIAYHHRTYIEWQGSSGTGYPQAEIHRYQNDIYFRWVWRGVVPGDSPWCCLLSMEDQETDQEIRLVDKILLFIHCGVGYIEIFFTTAEWLPSQWPQELAYLSLISIELQMLIYIGF